MRNMNESETLVTIALMQDQHRTQAEIAAVLIGCPVHGNAGMDWDCDGPFCHPCTGLCEHTARELDRAFDETFADLMDDPTTVALRQCTGTVAL